LSDAQPATSAAMAMDVPTNQLLASNFIVVIMTS
jgi:hypothetical protein